LDETHILGRETDIPSSGTGKAKQIEERDRKGCQVKVEVRIQ
jgi:hypothetical protein